MLATQRMRSLSIEQSWDALAELEAQRRSELNAFFSTPPNSDEAGWLADGIRAVMLLDNEIFDRCSTARDAAASQASQMGQGRRATAAYDENR